MRRCAALVMCAMAGCGQALSTPPAPDLAARDLSMPDLAAPDLAVPDLAALPDFATPVDYASPPDLILPSSCQSDPCVVALMAAFDSCWWPPGACVTLSQPGHDYSCWPDGSSLTVKTWNNNNHTLKTYATPTGAVCATYEVIIGQFGGELDTGDFTAGGHTWGWSIDYTSGLQPGFVCDGLSTICDLRPLFPSYSCPSGTMCPSMPNAGG